MSRHGGGEEFKRSQDGVFKSDSGSTLEFQGSHPVVYAAVSSHAHYPTAANYNYYLARVWQFKYGVGTASADLFDRTAKHTEFKTYEPARYRIISSDLPEFRVGEPKWLEFRGNWGPYEKLTDKIKFRRILKISIPVYTRSEIGGGVIGPKLKVAVAGEVWKGHFAHSSEPAPAAAGK
jgi:hypothetical protein